MPKILGWKKITRNYYRFEKGIVAKIVKLGSKRKWAKDVKWMLVIVDDEFLKYNYRKVFNYWHQAYFALIKEMKKISKEVFE